MAVKDDPEYEKIVEEYIRKGYTPNQARKKAYRRINKRGILN